MTQRTCTRPDCEALHYARGFCKPCYRRDYYLRNKERENANFKAYREANLEREKARFAAYAEQRWGAEQKARAEAKAARIAAENKQCTRCSTTKPKAEFHKDPRRADGRHSWCKACFYAHGAVNRDYDADRKRRRFRYATDPVYAESLREKSRRTKKIRYATDPVYAESVRRRVREWAKANPERASLNGRQAARLRRLRIKYQTIEKVDYAAVLTRDGMVCHICCAEILGFDDLHFDHVIPLSRGGEHSMANIKPAHATCNLRKGTKLLAELV